MRKINERAKIQLLEEVSEDRSWQEAEKFWIKRFKEMGHDLCNVTAGGDGTLGFHFKMPESAKKKISKKMTGRTVSAACKEKLRLGKLGINNPMYGGNFSKEHRANLSKALKGKEGGFKGWHHTKEAKIKIAAASRTRIITEETRAKMSESQRRRKRPPSKPQSLAQRRKLSRSITKWHQERRKKREQQANDARLFNE